VLREKTVGFNQLAEELESKSLKRDRVINQLRMASTRYTKKTTPSLVKYKSVIIIIGAPILLILLFTALSLARTYYNNLISPKDYFATGSGLEVAVVGERTNAVLHLVNQRGAAYTKQVKEKKCEVIPELTGRIIDCEIISKGNRKAKEANIGQYEISYHGQPTIRGRHQLHIKVEREHIKGSPFTVTVKLPVQELGTPIKTISEVKEPWQIISGVKEPRGVTVNQRGEILVAERCRYCISIFSPTGINLGSFGSKESRQFIEPCGVAVHDDNNILVADSGNHRIQKFTSDYKHIASVGSHGSNHLEFSFPINIAISPTTKKIAVSDWNNHRIQILNPDLTFHSIIGSEGSGNGLHDTAFDSAEKIYITDAWNNCIQVFNLMGQFLRQFGNRGKGDGELDFPTGISIDSDNTVYVVEAGSHRVSVFTREGKFLTSFGSQGYESGQFNDPYGITVDKQGTIYVTDGSNNRIQIFAN
jgi:hypothetical protein